jgi:hypothetical protein
MATLTIRQITGDGLDPTFSSAAALGDEFANDGQRTFLVVKNTNAATRTITVTSTAAAGTGLDDDMVFTVAQNKTIYAGPFPRSRFGATVSVTYDAVTDLTVAAMKV